MIKVYPASEAPRQVRKYTSANDEDAFITARDFYHRNKDIRHHKVVVYDADGSIAYCLGFQKNKPVNWEDAERAQRVAIARQGARRVRKASPKMLFKQLKELECGGVVHREVYPQGATSTRNPREDARVRGCNKSL